ncbi:MAG: porin [Planctomycetes bacterium]|nr:porin [Planctomycetota bacterium]
MSERIPVFLMGLLLAFPAFADTGASSVDERLRALEERVRAQDEEIRRLREELARQSEALPALEEELGRLVGKIEDEAFWQQPGTMRAYFRDGLWFETADKAFQIRVGGRLNLDAAGYRADTKLEQETGPFESETGFRRARMFISGRLFTRTVFKAEYDFAGSDVKFRDVWMGLTDIPVVETVRVGHQKEPFSQEQLMSGSALFFLERSLADAFAPKRNTGVLAESKAFDDRLVFSYGFFTDTDDAGEGPIGRGLTARVAGVPWLDRGLRAFVLIGLSGSHRRPREHEFRFSSRPESHRAETRGSPGATCTPGGPSPGRAGRGRRGFSTR